VKRRAVEWKSPILPSPTRFASAGVLSVCLLMSAALVGCGRTISLDCSPGAEQCACLEGSECADGLVCLSQLCVDPAPPDPETTEPMTDGDCAVQLAMTAECIDGAEITSVNWAQSRCAMEFGDEWTWVDHHYAGGWGVGGDWVGDSEFERGWAYISDQDAECFSSDYGMTWYRSASGATCNDPTGLDGPEFDPQEVENDIKCNAYTGDTPCEYCRPLICVRCG
jgi:hypothetical protein